VLTLLSSFLSWCVDDGLLADNVARVGLRHKDVKRLLRSDYDGKAAPYLKSWDEVMRLYRALSEPVSVLYLISARAGLRPGEVVALRWDDVDLDANTLNVSKQVRAGKEGPTKSGKPRTVPMGDVLASELATWRGRNLTGAASNDLVCPPPSRKRKNGTLASRMGTHLGAKSINQAMTAAFKKTGIAPGTLYEYGRHTFGSLAGLGGISAWRLQEVMGHADIKTTQRYVSLKGQALTDDERRAIGG
jgi:integrase